VETFETSKPSVGDGFLNHASMFAQRFKAEIQWMAIQDQVNSQLAEMTIL
jgi:hypothetical protein